MEALKKIALLLLCSMMPLLAHAEDAKPADDAKPESTITPAAKPPGTYSPGDCEFTITFPEDPYVSHHCESGDTKRCYDQVSYTKVYDMESTVNFRVTCNPTAGDMYDQYSGKVIQGALKAMTKDSTVSTYNTTSRETPEYKQAGLVGQGEVGVSPTLYIAQLWIGHKSVLSVEAEMIGAPHDKADALFTQVLKSVEFVSGKNIAGPAPEAKPEDKSNN